MNMDEKLLQQLILAFQGELADQLQVITDGLLLLEKHQEGELPQETLDTIFRAAHNIKGASRGVNVTSVTDIAHHLESLMSELRHGNLRPDSNLISVSLKALDEIRAAMQAHLDTPGAPFDTQAIINELGKLVAQKTTDPNNREVDPPQLPSEQEKPPNPSNEQEQAPLPSASSQAKQKSSPVQSTNNEIIRVTVDKLEQVSVLAEELQVAKIGMDDHFYSMQTIEGKIDQLSDLLIRTQNIQKELQQGNSSSPAEQLLSASEQALDDLRTYSSKISKRMRSTTSRLGFISSALQIEMRMLRLVPAATLLRPMVRSVRDIALQLDKQVNLSFTGDDVELDRAILDGIRDPLLHILRNAIDHGIELPAQRLAKGKPDAGNITIDVSNHGGQIQFEIHDDGVGIAIEDVRDAAIRKKISSEEQLKNMSHSDILQLIFRPGFSSKNIITDISGRGVGLDVVKSNLKQLKGNVWLETHQDEGTSFILQVPLTLSTERGLQVKAGGQCYVIPSTCVDKIIDITHKDVVSVEATKAIQFDNEPIPLRDLALVLQSTSNIDESASQFQVVVVSKGWQRVAFLVDEIEGEREIVIKSLQAPLMSVPNVTGATLTGSGEIIMVLNASDLVESALRCTSSIQLGNENSVQVAEHSRQILVVDDSITTRTLERTILESHGYEVQVSVDGQQAWNALQKHPFDLIVTDIEMPIMDGFEFTERVKQDAKFQDIPVVIVSSLAQEQEKRRGIEVGADAYIVKNQFESQTLLEIVQQLI